MALQAPVLEAVQAAGPAEFKHVSHAAAGTGPRLGLARQASRRWGRGLPVFWVRKPCARRGGRKGKNPDLSSGNRRLPLLFKVRHVKIYVLYRREAVLYGRKGQDGLWGRVGTPAGRAAAPGHPGRPLWPSQPGDFGAGGEGPAALPGAGGHLRPVHCGLRRLQAGQRHPGPPGRGPGHPPGGADPLQPLLRQGHCGSAGGRRVRGVPLREHLPGPGPGQGFPDLRGAAAGPGHGADPDPHRQRGGVPGGEGPGVRGAVPLGGPGPVRGQEKRQAPVLPEKRGREPGGPGGALPAGERHPLGGAAGEHGQRRGPAGAGGGPPR